MNREFRTYLLQFVFWMALQILVLNHLHVWGYLNPYPYVFFLLILPPKTPALQLMLMGFGMGLTLDFFSDSGGAHAAAATLIAYLRPQLIRLVTSRPLEEIGRLNLYSLSWSNFLVYAGMSLLLHHFVLFLLDAFQWEGWYWLLIQALASALFSLLIVVFHQLLSARKRNEFQ